MTVLNVLGSKVSVSTQVVPWSKKAVRLSKVPRGESPAQLAAKIGFTQAAIAQRGKTGKIGGLPAPCSGIRQALVGKDYGGKSESQRRGESHADADASLRAMQARQSKRA